MNGPAWIPALLVFLTAVFGTVALALLWEGIRDWSRRYRVARRVKPVLSGRNRRTGDSFDLIRQGKGATGPLRAVLNLVPGLGKLETLLEQSRLDLGIGSFLILMTGLAVGFGGTVYLISRAAIWVALSAAVGFLVPIFVASSRRKRRFRQFEEELPSAIELLTRAIRAGHPLSSALGMVADEGPPEVSAEFRRVFEEQRFGIPFEEALLGMVDRTDLMDVRIFSIAVLVQRDVGGNLAETLEKLAETIRLRFYLRRQLRTYTAQGRLTGYTLVALPFVVGLVISLLNPGYVSLLFTEFFGRVLIAAALVLQLVGALWIRKVVSIEM